MFTARRLRHLRNAFTPHIISPRTFSVSTTRQAATGKLEVSQLKPTTSLAKELLDTNLWKRARQSREAAAEVELESSDKADSGKSKTKRPRGRPAKSAEPKAPKAPKADKSRVNIVSEELCDDILQYIGPSLERHKGCDLIDIYPGAGLWSRKLHEFLEPRSHILMEPDHEFYAPFLQPLLDRPGTTIVPKSGIVWSDLSSIFTPEYLPHQTLVERGSEEANRQNDTLLVTANVAFHPRKRFSTFDSVASLILHQFVESIRTSSLFQRYGQVRVLIWTRREDKGSLLPRCMQVHKRSATEGEIYCESIREVAGSAERDSDWWARDSLIDKASTLAVAQRMRDSKTVMPPGRSSPSYDEALVNLENGVSLIPGSEPASPNRPFLDTLASLRTAHKEQEFQPQTADYRELKLLEQRLAGDRRIQEKAFRTSRVVDKMVALHSRHARAPPPADKMRALEAELTEVQSTFLMNTPSLVMTFRDNLHMWRQEVPLMHWDRRDIEPLAVSPAEFLPNVDCCLIDIQPKPVRPILRQQVGPDKKPLRAGETLELISRSMLINPTLAIGPSLDAVWPGAGDWIVPRCTTFRDVDRGGLPAGLAHIKYAQLTPRLLNADQWLDLLERWFEWPFRPTFLDLLSRSQDDGDTAEELGGGAGSGDMWT